MKAKIRLTVRARNRGLEFATGLVFMAGMTARVLSVFLTVLLGLAAMAGHALAQDNNFGISNFAPDIRPGTLSQSQPQDLILKVLLTEDSEPIPSGVVWRVFEATPGPDGNMPLVEMRDGGIGRFSLQPGTYLVHAAFGRAGVTKKVTISNQAREEIMVLNAGGLMLNAELPGGLRIPAKKLRFSIYDATEDITGERKLIIPNVTPNSVVRLNAGTYHVVSTYGAVNAVIRSDIRVQAGKLTTATVEHRAAQLTLKLVREHGGEAIADTQWSILTDAGDMVRESVAAFASVVLAEGNYTAIAKNKDRIFQRDFEVVAGRNQDVEVLVSDEVN